jgi:hypothetical protein
MKDLIEAFQIFLKYNNSEWPTHCERHAMYVNVDAELVSEEDLERLSVLGFVLDGCGQFVSYRFGSA